MSAKKVPQETQKGFLKAWFLDLYYKKLHMDYYYFCLQYKEHFDTIEAIRPNCILFVVLFLLEIISYQ